MVERVVDVDQVLDRAVAVNAGAGIYVSGKAAALEDAVEKPFEIITSGAARAKLDDFIKLTQKFK